MGLFSSRKPVDVPTCKLCDKPLTTENEQTVGLCVAHALIMDSHLRASIRAIDKYQPLANAATDPEEKIRYLQLMLDYLYEIKIKYYDNDLHPLDQDIEDLIDDVIDCISNARL